MVLYIVIPVHNRINLTNACLASLTNQTDKSFRVVIVDDGSTDGTQESIANLFGRQLAPSVLQGDGDLWWAGAIRMGAEWVLEHATEDDVIMTLNNDVTVAEDFISVTRRVIRENPDAMIGGISIDGEDRRTVWLTAWQIRSWLLASTRKVWWPCELNELKTKPPVIDVDFIPGTATCTPVRIARQYGLVDARRLPHYHADSEYSYRLKRSGVRVLLSRDIVVFHNTESTGVLGSLKTRPTLMNVLNSYFTKRSEHYLRDRWVFALTAAPWWAVVPFFICASVKVLVRGFGGYLSPRVLGGGRSQKQTVKITLCLI